MIFQKLFNRMHHGVLMLTVPDGVNDWQDLLVDIQNEATTQLRLRPAKQGDRFADVYPDWSYGDALNECIREKKDVTVGEAVAQASGRLYWLEFLWLGTDPGTGVGSVVAVTYQALDDVLKARQMAERRIQALEAVTYMATHDFSEPARKVVMFGNRILATEGDKLSQNARRWLEEIIVGGSTQLLKLIDDLYRLSKVDMDLKDLQPINLNDMVQEAVQLLNGTFEQSKAMLSVAELPSVVASPTIRQVFFNLISNSIKYQPPGQVPKIEITCKPVIQHEEKFWRIKVKDNGIGFDSEKHHNIFLPGARLHGVSSPYWGSGVGLAIVRMVVEVHGGKVWAKSALGRGSSFYFTLPRS